MMIRRCWPLKILAVKSAASVGLWAHPCAWQITCANCLSLLLLLPVAMFESSSFMLLSQRTKSFNQILIERWSYDFFAKINWDQDFWTFLEVWKDCSSCKLKHQEAFRFQFLKCTGTAWYIAGVWRWEQCPYLSRYAQIVPQNSAWSHRTRGNLEKWFSPRICFQIF